MNREFTVIKENTAWVQTITHIRTGQGWLYSTLVIDLFDRKVFKGLLSNTMRAKDTNRFDIVQSRINH
ncbi:hypothetical protein LXD69_11930 [Flavobacterium sediminilitoris]|uniref:Integrase-like protein n=1 Tax=Flavobacterium sediminilitoris TaxID=2024526 RepID=A0ABY4HIU8_9FLAO|nr:MULTISPECIES: hypothetical protein [Flavobacterium]UOX32744.1 hypothetical protein LXD69_11930 [Flavobacterium sediminilitoris]